MKSEGAFRVTERISDPKTNASEVANRLDITTTKLYAYVNGDGSVKDPGQHLLNGSIDK